MWSRFAVLADGSFAACLAGVLRVFRPGVGWTSLTVAALGSNDANVIPYGAGKALLDYDQAGVALFDGTAIQSTSRTGTWGRNQAEGPFTGQDGLLYWLRWTNQGSTTPTLAYATFSPSTGTFSAWTSVSKTDGALSSASSTHPIKEFAQLLDGRWLCMYSATSGVYPLVLNIGAATLTAPLGNATTLVLDNTLGTDDVPGLRIFVHGDGYVSVFGQSSGSSDVCAYGFDTTSGALGLAANGLFCENVSYSPSSSTPILESLSENGTGQIYAVASTADSANTTGLLARWWDPHDGFAAGIESFSGIARGASSPAVAGWPIGGGLLFLAAAGADNSSYSARAISPEGSSVPLPLPPSLHGDLYCLTGVEDQAGGYYVFSRSGTFRYLSSVKAYACAAPYFAVRLP